MKVLAFIIIVASLWLMIKTFGGNRSTTKPRKQPPNQKKQPTFYEKSDYAASKVSDQVEALPILAEKTSIPAHKRSSHLTTKNERRFYEALRQAIPSDYVIHCQVSLMALVQPIEWKDNSKTWAKRMDFVITDSLTEIVVVIELDDRTHNWKKRRIRDDYVNKVLDGQHRLVRFKSAKFYDPILIKQELDLDSAGHKETFAI